MIAIASLLIVLITTRIIIRIATVALRLTGMSDEAARFQSRSAYFGTGFTTSESEQVVNHPVRRRIVSLLMLLGHIGIVASSSTVIASFLQLEDDPALRFRRLVVLISGLLVFSILATSKRLDKLMGRIISWALNRYTHIHTMDVATLLHLRDDYQIAEFYIEPTSHLAGKTLAQTHLKQSGVLILGIEKPENDYEGSPRGNSLIEAGDNLIVYGLPENVERIDDPIEWANSQSGKSHDTKKAEP